MCTVIENDMSAGKIYITGAAEHLDDGTYWENHGDLCKSVGCDAMERNVDPRRFDSR